MSEYTRALAAGSTRTKMAFYAAAILLGAALGGLVLFVPPLYLMFLAGGLIYAYLLLAKIEIAIILALFLQPVLGQFNYLGGGTPFHPNGVMGIAIIAGAVFYFLFNKVKIPDFRRVGWFLLFFLLSAASILMVPQQYASESITVTIRLAAALSIFAVLLVRLDSIQKTKWVLGAYLAGQVYTTVAGLLIFAGRTAVSPASRLGDSGVGLSLAMTLILCMPFLLDARTNQRLLLWGSLTLLFGVGLYLSLGRAAWISFVAALVIIGLMRHKWVLVVVPLALVLALMLVPAISQRFSETYTFTGRVKIWQAALVIFSTHPIFGVGIGAGRYLVGEYLQQYSWMIHNDYVSVLLEVGLVGSMLFILWHGQWLASLLGIFRSSVQAYDKTMALAVLAVLLVSLVGRFTDNIVLDSYDMYPLCALVGTAMALPRIRMKTEHTGG